MIQQRQSSKRERAGLGSAAPVQALARVLCGLVVACHPERPEPAPPVTAASASAAAAQPPGPSEVSSPNERISAR